MWITDVIIFKKVKYFVVQKLSDVAFKYVVFIHWDIFIIINSAVEQRKIK